MAHAIEVSLSANVDKFNQGMAAAKKTSADSVGSITTSFSALASYFGKMSDSTKSFLSDLSGKASSAWGSFSSSASSAFDKVLSVLPGMGNAVKDAGDKMDDADKKSDGLISKIGTGLVVAFTAAAVAITAFTAKGLMVDSAFAKISISTDVGASTLSQFEDVAKRSGMSVAQLGASVSTFQAAMKEAAAGSGGDMFDKLHVSVKNSNDELLATGPTLIDFAKHVAAMSSEAEKYGAAAKSGFSVQFLEDLAHSSTLAAGTTDDQAAAVVRLGKVFHEILPSGKSLWEDISTSLSNKLTPALTTASVAILESKNQIVDAFNQIYGGGSLFDKLTEKVKGWADGMAGYFAGVVKSATSAGIGLAEYIAKATGLGKALTAAPSSGYVPAKTPLASGATVTAPDATVTKQISDYNAASAAIKAKNDVTREEIATGQTLTDSRKQQILLAAAVRDGTVKMTESQYFNRMEELAQSGALESAAKASKDAQAAAEAAAKKEAEQYASVSAAIAGKIAENKLELVTGTAVTEGQKLAIKIDSDQASGKRSLTDAHLAAAKAALVELDAAEKLVAQQKAQQDVAKYIDASTTARYASRNALEAEYQAYGKGADALSLLSVAVDAQTWKQKELDKLSEAHLPISAQTIIDLDAEVDARTKVGQAILGQSKALAYATQLQEDNKRYAAEQIVDATASKQAILTIDADVWQKRIANAGAGTEAQKLLQKQYDTWYATRTAQADPWYGLQESLKNYGRTASDVGAQIGGALTDAFTGAEDAFVKFATSGKLSFSDLATSIVSDLARIAAKQALSGIASFLGTAIGDYFGGGAITDAMAASSHADELARITTQASLPGRATGGPVTAGTTYMVGERGPEIFQPTGGGTIIPNNQISGSSAPNITIQSNVNIDASGATTTTTTGDQSTTGKQLSDMISAKAKEIVVQETRQGGVIWKMQQGRG